ncbi:hypothetical protein CFP56_006621 [Quercus suber]|uniref:Uncharacterized protein n=1 Tax=Quercus suber TaxID=58331 RepID=A0AAW0L971_QUESU
MLQPFPPPTPPLSLTPSSSPSNDGLLISRDKVRDALLMLVQIVLDCVVGVQISAQTLGTTSYYEHLSTKKKYYELRL